MAKHKKHSWGLVVYSENHRLIAEMKRIGNIYEKLCSVDNILLAFNNAKKGKKHYAEVKMIESDPDKYLGQLQQVLLSNSFKTSEYSVFKKQSGYKLREIYKLPFYPDRIVHHCIVQILQKKWTDSLIRDTFSTIPGRGIHDGVARFKKALRDNKNTRYCLKLDIKKYYPSIDHDILKRIIARKIKDKRMLDLLFNIIDSAPGIPIGNYVSQWFGNLYLSDLDHFCKEKLKCKYYFRYCDDIVILSSKKDILHSLIIAINQYISENLNLTLKSNYQVFPVDKRGVDFLGYRFFHDYTLVRKSIVKNMKKKIHLPKSLQSYWGWLKHADSYRLTQKYFNNESKFRHSA